MKVNIYEQETLKEEWVDIHCYKETPVIEDLAQLIREKTDIKIIGTSDKGEEQLLSLADLFYFESVEKKCFAYLAESVYQVDYTLREIEEALRHQGFLRINKSTVVNIYKIDHIHYEYNMRIRAYLLNGEKLIISRRYNKEFQEGLDQIKNLLLGK